MMPNQTLSDDDIKTLLDNINVGTISTIGQDGMPYGTPVNFVTVDGSIAFHGGQKGEKLGNLRRDPRCCFTVTWSIGYERTGDAGCNTTALYQSVIIRGRAVEILDPEKKMRILRSLVDKITPERRDDPIDPAMVDRTTVFVIEAEYVTGKHRMHNPQNITYVQPQ